MNEKNENLKSDEAKSEVRFEQQVSQHLYLNVEVNAGTEITYAAKEACELADRLGLTVHTKFNGVTCIIRPGSNYLELVGKWYIELGSNKQYKIVVSG